MDNRSSLARYALGTLRNLNPALLDVTTIEDIQRDAFMTTTQFIKKRRSRFRATVSDMGPWLRQIISHTCLNVAPSHMRHSKKKNLFAQYSSLLEAEGCDKPSLVICVKHGEL